MAYILANRTLSAVPYRGWLARRRDRDVDVDDEFSEDAGSQASRVRNTGRTVEQADRCVVVCRWGRRRECVDVGDFSCG